MTSLGSGRVAIVTGAGRGIGAATTFALAELGWSVLAVDIASNDSAVPYDLASPEDLEASVAAARQVAITADAVVSQVVDVRDVDALRTAVQLAQERWGGLDAAIGCAAVIAGGSPAWELSAEQAQAVVDIDLGGVMNLARVAVPAMLERPQPRSGRFIAVASAAATTGLPMLAAYCAAKAGVAGFVRALAAELGPTGVTANAVSPGSTDTSMLTESARLYDLADSAAFAAQQPLGRLIHGEEIAAVIAFLASGASSAMTGAVVPVDGGLSL